MLTMITILLTALVALWIAFPLLPGNAVESREKLSAADDELEREIDELRRRKGSVSQYVAEA